MFFAIVLFTLFTAVITPLPENFSLLSLNSTASCCPVEAPDGEIAEAEGHHPDLWFGWGYAKIKIFTHAIKGLAESDFILAAKIDKIFSV